MYFCSSFSFCSAADAVVLAVADGSTAAVVAVVAVATAVVAVSYAADISASVVTAVLSLQPLQLL